MTGVKKSPKINIEFMFGIDFKKIEQEFISNNLLRKEFPYLGKNSIL